jgi:IS5 family transposase
MAHALMENRHGLIVDTETTLATGTAEREAALTMGKRTLKTGDTLGTDKAYDVKELVAELEVRGIKPHIARNLNAYRGSAVSDEVAAEPGYAISQRIRKRIEQVFGWGKTVGPLRKTKLRGLANSTAQSLMTFAAYNLIRLRKLLCLRPIMAPA